MKCPKCGINLLEHVDTCPFCKTHIENNNGTDEAKAYAPENNTGRFSAIDPAKDSYDFDLQYTLTFRDSGEIKQAIADMESGISKDSERKSSGKAKSGEPRYTLEEMQAAALRAQERRERRNAGKKPLKDGKKRVSYNEKRKRDALRAAKPRAKHSAEDKNYKSHRGLLMGAGVLALVIVLIIGVVNICAFFTHKDPEYPTVYTKGNELYSFYNDKEELLSTNFITMQLESSGSNKDAKKQSDPKIKTVDALTEKKLINISDDGSKIFFLENVNMNTRSGNLVYYENGKKKSRTVLGQNVYYDMTIGKNGSTVLYLKNADETGAHGELCYWTPNKKEAVSVEMDITAGNFKLAQDGMSATYIKNFNPTVHTGDLCFVNFAEGAEMTKRVDEKVAFVFGTTPKSKIYFYAKNYDNKTGTYDLYIQSDTEGPKMLAEKGLNAPVISQKTENAYVFSNYNKNFQTLSCVDLATGANTKLADEVTDLVKVRIDDGAVIYSKAYESDKADYYFVNAKTPNPQTVATAVNLKAIKEKGIVSFDASDDFSKIAYIGGFDTDKNMGALYTLSVINDYAGSEMRISDDAYSCDVSADGATVRFATGYNFDTNTVSIVSYANSNTLGLANAVAAGAFTFDKTGEYTIYAKDVNAAEVEGKIETVNAKGKIKTLDDGVNAYGLKKNGTVLLLKKTINGTEELTTLYKTKLKGGKPKVMAEGVARVLSY